MSLFTRFFGKREAVEHSTVPLAANPNASRKLGLNVLFSAKPSLNSENLTHALRNYHALLANARCEIDAKLAAEGNFVGLIGWEKHVVQLIGFDVPMPAEAAEACIAPAHFPQELKTQARAHTSHILLYYAGHEDSTLEQYVALAVVAGALARMGAVAVLNEAAGTMIPARVLSGDEIEGDVMELIRTLPLLFLYCGFVKGEAENDDGVWMLTYGADAFDMPDLAAHAEGHHQGTHYCNVFEGIFGYLRGTGAKLAPGHTIQSPDEDYFRFRAPTKDESSLFGEGERLVLEIIRPDEINR